jgi:hypothetical protein
MFELGNINTNYFLKGKKIVFKTSFSGWWIRKII